MRDDIRDDIGDDIGDNISDHIHTLSKHFIKALYQSTLHKHFIQALYPSTLSKHFIRALYQGISKSILEIPVKVLQRYYDKVLRQDSKQQPIKHFAQTYL